MNNEGKKENVFLTLITDSEAKVIEIPKQHKYTVAVVMNVLNDNRMLENDVNWGISDFIIKC